MFFMGLFTVQKYIYIYVKTIQINMCFSKGNRIAWIRYAKMYFFGKFVALKQNLKIYFYMNQHCIDCATVNIL